LLRSFTENFSTVRLQSTAHVAVGNDTNEFFLLINDSCNPKPFVGYFEKRFFDCGIRPDNRQLSVSVHQVFNAQ
jgi:hypothetical protein